MNNLTENGIHPKLVELSQINSSASEIDSIGNVANHLLAPIHKLFREAANGVNTNVKYCVVGDSTRDNNFNEMIDYYTTQLAKINVVVFDNAESGQSGYDWAYNIDQTTLNQLLTFIGANEDNCIIEFSHGINDYKNGATQEQVKTWLRYGLTQLITAKPKVKIILCTPINTSGADRNSVLKTIYQELASELKLPLVDCTIPTAVGTIQGNSNFYQDTTHPNKFGSRRIVNYILDKIIPLDVLYHVTITPYDSGTTPPQTIIPTTKQVGYYNTADGIYNSLSTWRSLTKIPVEPNFQLKITHKGNRNDQLFYTSDNAFISILRPTVTNFERTLTIPNNAFFLSVNLSSDGVTYDALNDTPIVEYYNPASGLYLTIEDINSGLNIRNILDRFKNGILMDDYGMVGTSGQSLKIDANGKMKWS